MNIETLAKSAEEREVSLVLGIAPHVGPEGVRPYLRVHQGQRMVGLVVGADTPKIESELEAHVPPAPKNEDGQAE